MKTLSRTIFWVVLLLVAFDFVTPDPVEVTPGALSDGVAVWTVSNDDDLGHAHNYSLASDIDLLLPFPGLMMAMFAVLGAVRPFLNANDPKHFVISRRNPRSAPTD
jgi:hypothetical protein